MDLQKGVPIKKLDPIPILKKKLDKIDSFEWKQEVIRAVLQPDEGGKVFFDVERGGW